MPSTGSVLFNRQGLFVLPFSLAVYVLLQYTIMASSLCTTAEPFAPWALKCYFAMGFTFFATGFEQMVKMLICHRQSRMYHRLLYLTAFVISLVAGSSNLLTSLYGGVCKDALGVESPVAQWGEWLVCVPLMVYINIAIEDKDQELSDSDLAIIFLTSISILLGFMMNFHEPFAVGVIFFSLANFCFIAFPLYSIKCSKRAVKPQFSRLRSNLSTVETRVSQEQDLIKATKYAYLSRLLFIIFPLFPLVYLLAFFKFLDRDQTIVVFGAGGIIVKMFFSNILVDAKVGISDLISAQRRLKRSADESRNIFLRYVFHELRTPLHTLTMGMTVIEGDKIKSDQEGTGRLFESRDEVVNMMQGATDFMSNTLSDVLLIHKIEEGLFEITKIPFHLHDVIGMAVHTLQYELGLKDINVTIENIENTAHMDHHSDLFLGDRSKLEAVVVDFLSNAIRRSCSSSNIEITVVKRFISETIEEKPHGFMKMIKNSSQKFITTLCNIIPRYRARTLSASENTLRETVFPSYHTENDHENYELLTAKTVCEVTLTIKDHGNSITEEDMLGLLTPYTQIRPNQKCSEQGRDTGLWLVLAKEIIILHHGQLMADSNPGGEGNVFGFVIPFQLIPPAQLNMIIRSPENAIGLNSSDSQILSHTNGSSSMVHRLASSQNIPRSPKKNKEDAIQKNKIKKVLIVDDTPSNCKMLSMLLRGRNIESDIVENGRLAVQAVACKGPYDFIFMDFTMPIMNGADATRQIRCGGYTQLIFGLTGNALEDDVNYFLKAGADCVVAKPLRRTQLDAILKCIDVYGRDSVPNVKLSMVVSGENAYILKEQ